MGRAQVGHIGRRMEAVGRRRLFQVGACVDAASALVMLVRWVLAKVRPLTVQVVALAGALGGEVLRVARVPDAPGVAAGVLGCFSCGMAYTAGQDNLRPWQLVPKVGEVHVWW